MWRPVAERLATAGRTVVTYDRRGTLRSGRQDWPGGGSPQHADDAAALVRGLGLRDVVVFGGSSGGIVAVQLAMRHPLLVRCCLSYEPGYVRCVPAGTALQERTAAAVAGHLEHHPGDWAGAYEAFAAAVAPAAEPSPPGAPGPRPPASVANAATGTRGLLVSPPGREWYARREAGNAEAFLRDEVPILTRELVDEPRLASLPVDIRFAHGTDSPEVFRDVATHLATVRGGIPDVIDGAGHVLCLRADAAAAYILARNDRPT
jgi:pimeloyl-ACP methyl ester carboxylesterase